jgi:hypothetical protein
LLPPSADTEGNDVIAESYLPDATSHNDENIGLETVWPYDLIGDTSPLFALARRTYAHRAFSAVADWSFDPIQAARLGLGDEVGSTLVRVTESSQHTVNGLANWDADYGEFYVEQDGVVADALQEALVQDYDGLIRIAPAIPAGWDFEGSVYVRGNTKVDVQMRNGVLTTVVFEAGTAGTLKFRNPWIGEPVDVICGKAGVKILQGSIGPDIGFDAAAGTSCRVARHGEPTTTLPFAPLSGTAARSAKKLGAVQIGLFNRGQ